MTQQGLKNIDMDILPSKFDIGKEVYVLLGPYHSGRGTITAYRTWAIKDEQNDRIRIIPNAVRLDIFTHSGYFDDIESDAVPFKYLANSEEQIEKWSKKITVKISDGDWNKVVGRRQHDTFEEFELQPCCNSISNIREMLFLCRDNDGLIGWEVEQLQETINNSTHDMPTESPILESILEQLNIIWISL